MELFSVQDSDHQTPLRLFIKKMLKKYSSREIERFLASGGCEVNRKLERFGSSKVYAGDQVRLWTQHFKATEPTNLPILFEDEHLLVVNKPQDMASDLKTLQKFIKPKVFLVHRLDKLTSGVLILAKTLSAQAALENLFFERKIQKNYVAVVHGRLQEAEGEINQPISLKKRFEGGSIYQANRKFGKKAITKYKRLALSKNESLLLLKPITGRTHQLRVHLSSLSHPILGDPIYTQEQKVSSLISTRLCLHAYKIAFTHPMTGKNVAFIAPIESIMNALIQKRFKRFKLCDF